MADVVLKDMKIETFSLSLDLNNNIKRIIKLSIVQKFDTLNTTITMYKAEQCYNLLQIHLLCILFSNVNIYTIYFSHTQSKNLNFDLSQTISNKDTYLQTIIN